MKLSKPLRIIRNLLLFFFISTTVTVVVYSFMPVYVTPLMIIRSVQQVFKGESPVWYHEWVPFDKLSPHLPMAVIASEDNRFATHNGFVEGLIAGDCLINMVQPLIVQMAVAGLMLFVLPQDGIVLGNSQCHIKPPYCFKSASSSASKS